METTLYIVAPSADLIEEDSATYSDYEIARRDAYMASAIENEIGEDLTYHVFEVTATIDITSAKLDS